MDHGLRSLVSVQRCIVLRVYGSASYYARTLHAGRAGRRQSARGTKIENNQKSKNAV